MTSLLLSIVFYFCSFIDNNRSKEKTILLYQNNKKANYFTKGQGRGRVRVFSEFAQLSSEKTYKSIQTKQKSNNANELYVDKLVSQRAATGYVAVANLALSNTDLHVRGTSTDLTTT